MTSVLFLEIIGYCMSHIVSLSQECSQMTTGSDVESVAIHSWIQSTFSGTHG